MSEAGVAQAVEKKITALPRHEWVLIRKLIRGEEIVDGVIRPEAQDERAQKGEVLALSSQTRRDRWGNEIPNDLKVGDIVIFTNYPIDIPELEEMVGEKNVCLVRDEEIYAVAVERN